MRSVCQEPRNLINPVLCLWDSYFNADSRWENSFLGCRENNAAPLSRSRLESVQRSVTSSLGHCLSPCLSLYSSSAEITQERGEISRSSKIVSRVTSDKTKGYSVPGVGKTDVSFSFLSTCLRKVTFTCFLREAKVGVLEMEKICIPPNFGAVS